MELNEALGQRVRKGRIDSIRLVETVSAQQWSAWGRKRNKESSRRLQRNERFPQVAGRRPDWLRERLRCYKRILNRSGASILCLSEFAELVKNNL